MANKIIKVIHLQREWQILEEQYIGCPENNRFELKGGIINSYSIVVNVQVFNTAVHIDIYLCLFGVQLVVCFIVANCDVHS